MPIPLAGFDFDVLDDPEFKEDAVREEIVAPFLRALGYSASGQYRIRRSPSLEHPYVSIGSIRRPVKLFPDYILTVSERPVCVVDAKGPGEDLDDADHLSQVYTYAVHRDVQSPYYALCNGRRFVLYSVARMTREPLYDLDLTDLENEWFNALVKLAPLVLYDTIDSKYSKDFGLHLQRLGLSAEMRLMFPGIPVFRIGRSGPDLYVVTCNIHTDEGEYAATFDFAGTQAATLVNLLPMAIVEQTRRALGRWPSVAVLAMDGTVVMNVSCYLSEQLQENEQEIYRTLIVEHVS